MHSLRGYTLAIDDDDVKFVSRYPLKSLSDIINIEKKLDGNHLHEILTTDPLKYTGQNGRKVFIFLGKY